ncbi:MAG: alpha/beta fold hydrolase [Terriglobales bacterium]
MPSQSPELVEHRSSADNPVAVLFIHGFSGDPIKTWGKFPDFLTGEKRLARWDVFSLGYHTGLSLDVVGIWRADPGLISLADLLATRAALEPLKRYKSVALIAHSMGGLVVQRAILDNPELRQRVGYVLLFGTPSAGLSKASWFEFWKPQVEDMADNSGFIKDLRARWTQTIGGSPTFKLCATAGDLDQFVPPQSSIQPFAAESRRVVRGDHLSIVKPLAPTDPSVQIVIETLAGNSPPSGPGDSARVAVEMRDFYQAIATLESHPESLDEGGLVQLALALESVGRQPEAIEVLRKRKSSPGYTDAMGTLAGRLKRRWLVQRTAEDADTASDLYQQAFDSSEKANDHAQAFYHGINVAFMQLVYRHQKQAAKETATKVLAHCQASEPEKWRYATEGEAHLLLGEFDQAMENYQKAVDSNPLPRELDSMYQQALRVASLVGDDSVADRLQKIFRGGA